MHSTYDALVPKGILEHKSPAAETEQQKQNNVLDQTMYHMQLCSLL